MVQAQQRDQQGQLGSQRIQVLFVEFRELWERRRRPFHSAAAEAGQLAQRQDADPLKLHRLVLLPGRYPQRMQGHALRGGTP